MKIFKYIIVLSLLLTHIKFTSQTLDLGLPISFSSNNLKPIIDVLQMPNFDLTKQLEADEYNHKNKIGPYRFGYEHIVSIDLITAGKQDILANGDKLYRKKIICPGAYSINLVFDDFYIPEGAFLHIYNNDKTTIIGAYTHINNNKNNSLGTSLVKGEEIIVEYYEPSYISNSRLLIGMIVHGYKDINNWFPQKVNESGACNMDVICPDGNSWSNENRSVARIVVGGGLCTGSLVNNTLEDGTPYFLTANHCGPNSMSNAVFKFNYDSPICGSQSSANSQAPSGNNSINGSSLVASNSASDFGLVELNSIPPANYGVYYAGWNNSSLTPQSAVSIHHPSGDVKKISFDDDILQTASVSGSANMWKIEAWERSTTTEGGSSGGALWDQDHYLIGQLYGGQATCSNSVNDYYGKFSLSWTGNNSSQSSKRLKDWLDPNNSGVTTLNGFDPNNVSIANNSKNSLELSIYPNPSEDFAIIKVNSNKLNQYNISISEMSGKIVFKTIINDNQEMYVNTKDLASGIYLINVLGDDVFLHKKLIKK